MHPKIKYFSNEEWAEKSALLISLTVEDILLERGSCSVMLTGGGSAEELYRCWAKFPSFHKMSLVNFFFTDERCVPTWSEESNYGMAKRCLFSAGIPSDCFVYRMNGEMSSLEDAAAQYEKILPPKIDVLLLGVGEDGHVASLFPCDPALNEIKKNVMFVKGPKLPALRLTVTPNVIRNAKNVFLISKGGHKAKVLAKSILSKGEWNDLPLRLALESTWLIDESTANELSLLIASSKGLS